MRHNPDATKECAMGTYEDVFRASTGVSREPGDVEAERGIADGHDEPVPSTVDDASVIEVLRPVLRRR
jgi:hypothetical protein